MTERAMYAELKRAWYPAISFHSIETGATATGIPDIYYSSMVSPEVGWIELKIAEEKKDGRLEIPYRPGQTNFLMDYLSRGNKAYTLIYYKDLYYLTQWFTRNFASWEELRQKSLFAMGNLCWHGLFRELTGVTTNEDKNSSL